MNHAQLLEQFSLTGKAAIVTGGATGLGLAFVEAMAAAGARVTMLDLNDEALAREEARLRGEGYEVTGMRVDVTKPAELDKAFDEVAARCGSLDIVFANAGKEAGPGFSNAKGERLPQNAIENYSDSRWHEIIEISLDAVFYAVRAAARHMRPQRSGRIIVITSIATVRPSPNAGAAYAAAKMGAAHVSRAFAQELAPDNILVNVLCPGPFATGVVAEALKDKDVAAKVAARAPLGRIGHPDEIKALALFLASPASSYVTGQQFVIDGGATFSG